MSHFQTPVIFDESFGEDALGSGRFGDQFDGLLARPGGLLSMSAYEKPPTADMLDLHTTAALHEASQPWAYAQPHFNSVFYPSDFPVNGQDSGFQYSAGPDFTQHLDFVSHRPSNDPRTRPTPEITYYLSEGSQGTIARVHLQTLHDLHAPPPISASLVFGYHPVQGMISSIGDVNGPLRQYEITAEVPSFVTTGWHSFSVPLALRMEGSDGSSLSPPDGVFVGQFTYKTTTTSSSQSRKRKASSDSEYDLQPSNKRIITHQMQVQDAAESLEYGHGSPYSPFFSTPTAGVRYVGHAQTASPRPSGHHYSTSTASQVSLAAPSPATPAWSPGYTIKTEPSPHPPMTPVPQPASTSSPLKSTVPKLVRTSTIQQSPVAVASASINPQSFNPYAMYPLKATLKLQGDLDAVAKDWTSEELDARRRLVEFTRTQTDSTILASFKAVAPEDRMVNNITISCIYWKEKKEYFVTSVDTIYLLEALVGVRFTVEEKNRIRRNLEGFRPLTVSKAKADSEDFFKVIMGFPAPKPRNIEKDVKVFPWKILSTALKKIIGKYSASYSSTASAILTPASSAYGSTEGSLDYVSGSPNPEYATTSMTNYPITTSAGYSSDRIHPGVSAEQLRLQMPTVAPQYSIPGGYHLQNMPPMSHAPNSHMVQSMSAPASVRMPAWEFATFVNESPASMAPASASAVATYQKGSIDTADFTTYSN